VTPPVPFAAILERFELNGHFVAALPFGSGHINDTYLVRFARPERRTRFVLQRINTSVFPDPAGLMENLDRVTAHLCRDGHDSLLVRQAEFVPIRARNGSCVFHDDRDNWWRLFPYLFGTKSVDAIDTPALAWAAGAAFGRFQRLLLDLPPPPLVTTIAGFHDTMLRYRRFEDAVAEDAFGRARQCAAEIDCARRFEEAATLLTRLEQSGELPVRIAHNDAKISNVLYDERSGEPACVVDLDTVMPGLALHDFGDLVRTAAATGREDATSQEQVGLSMACFTALAEGYLGESGGFLAPAETENLAAAGLAITVETGLRFLTDYLQGDIYFRIHRPAHNLERCRAQFRLADAIAAKLGHMQAEVEALLGGIRDGNAAHA